MRRHTKTYQVTGTPPATTPAKLTFTDDDGNSVDTIPLAWARALAVRCENTDVADDTVLSFRLADDIANEAADFVEVVSLANAENATTFTQYSEAADDAIFAGSKLQVFWVNETGAGTAGTIVTLYLKE